MLYLIAGLILANIVVELWAASHIVSLIRRYTDELGILDRLERAARCLGPEPTDAPDEVGTATEKFRKV